MQKEGREEEKKVVTPQEVILTPAVDIYETENAFVLLADLPGVDKENLHVDVKEGELSIDGRANGIHGKDERTLVEEFKLGRYLRKFALDDTIDCEKIEASFKNGVLKLILPKVEKAKPKKIEVKVVE